jgi:hypothetical protein
MVYEGWRKRSLALCLPHVHSKLLTRVRRNTPKGNYTGTHTSRRTHPHPEGRKENPGSVYPDIEYI